MRALIYARVAVQDETTEEELARQLAACREYAKANGYAVTGEYSEVGGGHSLDTPEMNALLERVGEGGISAVIAHTPDRVSRELAALETFMNRLAEHDAELLVVEEEAAGE